MALRPTCDVFLTAVEGVQTYEVIVRQISRTGIADNADPPVPVIKTVDLCPRALERLKVKIVGGTTPPAERKKKDSPYSGATELAPGDAALAK